MCLIRFVCAWVFVLVRMCACMFVRECMCGGLVCIYERVFVCVCTYLRLCICVGAMMCVRIRACGASMVKPQIASVIFVVVHMSAYAYARKCLFSPACVYVCVFLCVCVCMCVYVSVSVPQTRASLTQKEELLRQSNADLNAHTLLVRRLTHLPALAQTHPQTNTLPLTKTEVQSETKQAKLEERETKAMLKYLSSCMFTSFLVSSVSSFSRVDSKHIQIIFQMYRNN